MNAFPIAPTQETAAALVLTLIHSLWQGAALAGVAYAALTVLPARRPGARYAVSLAALSGIVLAAAVTWSLVSGAAPAQRQESTTWETTPAIAGEGVSSRGVILQSRDGYAASSTASTEAETAAARPFDSLRRTFTPEALTRRLARWAPALSVAWAAGVMLMLLRTALSLGGVSRLRREAAPVRDGEVSALVEELRKALGVTRRVTLAVSQGVRSPCVLGILCPMIVAPPALLTGMPVEHVRAILAHELAHVRRHDYLVSIAQRVVEALFFFNPFVWWLSREIRVEREACCDAVAAGVSGRPEAVAEVLVAWTARTMYGATPEPAFAPGRSSLVERMRRLAFPSERPSPHAPWYALVGALVVSATLLAVLAGAGAAAVQVAEKMLSTEERIQKIEETRKAYGEIDYGKGKITVSGVVRTEDGAPIARHNQMIIDSRAGNGGGSSYGMNIGEDGSFSQQMTAGEVLVGVSVPGYAPAFAGPFRPEKGADVTGIDILLKKGFAARVRLVDGEGRPVAGARVSGFWRTGSVGVMGPSGESDGDGIVMIEDGTTAQLDLYVEANGWQYDSKSIEVSPEKTEDWTLLPARPTTGMVVSRETGKPIVGAEVCLLERMGFRGTIRFPKSDGARPDAVTDEQGRFTLSTLRDDSVYAYYADAGGFAPAAIRQVKAGMSGIIFELGPEVNLAGRITGIGAVDATKLKGITYWQEFKVESQTINDNAGVRVEMADGEARFELRDLWAQPVSIVVLGKRFSFDLSKPGAPREVTIDLSEKDAPAGDAPAPPPTPAQTRPVVLRFVPSEGMPKPAGSFEPGGAGRRGEVPVVDGEARFEAPPGYIHWQTVALEGYVARSSAVRVPEGEGEFVHEVECMPAGALCGVVRDADGAPAARGGEGTVFLSAIESAPPQGAPRMNASGQAASDGRFVLSPIALGGAYAVVARRGSLFVIAEAPTLDAATPVKEMEVCLPAGMECICQVVDPDGKPMAGEEVRLHYSTPWSHGFGGSPLHTDPSGIVRFERMNPDVPGKYEIVVESRREWRPVRQEFGPSAGSVTVRRERGLVVTGRVVNEETGEPVAGAEVMAWRQEGERYESLEAEGPTDADGGFRFSNMADADYDLMVRSMNLADKTRVRGGQAEPVELRRRVPPGFTGAAR